MATDDIGASAGKVWEYLHNNGSASATKIQKGIGEKSAITNQAIGWLAREGKLAVDTSKRTPQYSLR